MAVNTDKTKCMLVKTHQKARRLQRKRLNITLINETLENVTCEKLLGVHVGGHLTWNTHISKVAVTISRNLAPVRRIKIVLPIHARKTFYFANIQPHFDYCSTIWGLGSNIKKMVSLQRRAIRLMLGIQYGVDLHLFSKC